MRTTVDISDDLLINAKKRAVEMNKPLRSLIEEGLRTFLMAKPKRSHIAGKIEWVPQTFLPVSSFSTERGFSDPRIVI